MKLVFIFVIIILCIEIFFNDAEILFQLNIQSETIQAILKYSSVIIALFLSGIVISVFINYFKELYKEDRNNDDEEENEEDEEEMENENEKDKTENSNDKSQQLKESQK